MKIKAFWNIAPGSQGDDRCSTHNEMSVYFNEYTRRYISYSPPWEPKILQSDP
jgi:hypothetical protein